MGRAFEYRKASKFARWDKMAKQFSKASRQITIAVKQAGPDPDSNLLLRRAIQNAKSVQMPKDKIENAIKKGTDQETDDYDELVYEGMGPHGVAIVVETATDNAQRTVANVRSYFRKKGGSLGIQGMHDFLFDRKGVFYVPLEEVPDKDALELEMIDHGLEEMENDTLEEKQYYKLYTAFEDFGKLQEALENRKINVEKSDLERIPKITKELGDDEVDEVLELVDLMEQDDDVTNVFHNLA